MSLWLFVVRFGHWVCGESWHAMKDFNPPPQFSKPGTWCPTFLCASVLFVLCVYLVGEWGVEGDFCFFFLFSILWPVCYKHTFHVV